MYEYNDLRIGVREGVLGRQKDFNGFSAERTLERVDKFEVSSRCCLVNEFADQIQFPNTLSVLIRRFQVFKN